MPPNCKNRKKLPKRGKKGKEVNSSSILLEATEIVNKLLLKNMTAEELLESLFRIQQCREEDDTITFFGLTDENLEQDLYYTRYSIGCTNPFNHNFQTSSSTQAVSSFVHRKISACWPCFRTYYTNAQDGFVYFRDDFYLNVDLVEHSEDDKLVNIYIERYVHGLLGILNSSQHGTIAETVPPHILDAFESSTTEVTVEVVSYPVVVWIDAVGCNARKSQNVHTRRHDLMIDTIRDLVVRQCLQIFVNHALREFSTDDETTTDIRQYAMDMFDNVISQRYPPLRATRNFFVQMVLDCKNNISPESLQHTLQSQDSSPSSSHSLSYSSFENTSLFFKETDPEK